MKDRPACYKCNGHITNKQIKNTSKHHKRWGELFYCEKCQKEIDKKYGSGLKHGKSVDNKSNKEYWKSCRLKDKMLNGDLKKI